MTKDERLAIYIKQEEKGQIERTLRHCGYSKIKTAEFLGMTGEELTLKIIEHKISEDAQ